MKIALLGAESTGKTQLSQALAEHLLGMGRSVTVVAEVLREWCEQHGRTPREAEQLAIAQEQARRVDAAAATSDIVIADTTPLMIAVYSAMLFGDESLYDFALAHQRSYTLTLVTGLDIPWEADGLQRDGPHVREPVDSLVRAALERAGIVFKVVYGTGRERLANALLAMAASTAMREGLLANWSWSCDKCSDPECEHRLFTGLLRSKAAGRPSP
ncbi:MAG: ATP-binding protein [Bdellovibrionales bacterium]|nr:ATP-binding protein [Ramlibacter sp.]